MLHPEGHFTDTKAGRLRAETYPRLRRHYEFRNEAVLFEDVGHARPYGISIYGSPRNIRFIQVVGMHLPETVDLSLEHDGSGEVPGARLLAGGWDRRPHRSRIVTVDPDTLTDWVKLFDPPGTTASQARLVRPLSVEHLTVLRRFANQSRRMSDLQYRWSSGWHEKGAKSSGFIAWDTRTPVSWDEAIIQGPHFFVATPLDQQPNIPCRNFHDYSPFDLEELPETLIPRTNYQRVCDRKTYEDGLTVWDGEPYTSYWRLAWARMIDPTTERTLCGAVIPPGPAHVHTVHSLALRNDRETCLVAGLWSSLPLDYLVKISGKADLQDELIQRFPAPLEHPSAQLLRKYSVIPVG